MPTISLHRAARRRSRVVYTVRNIYAPTIQRKKEQASERKREKRGRRARKRVCMCVCARVCMHDKEKAYVSLNVYVFLCGTRTRTSMCVRVVCAYAIVSTRKETSVCMHMYVDKIERESERSV